eukprot:6291588-Alexandrium_andersonii.AAC.1
MLTIARFPTLSDGCMSRRPAQERRTTAAWLAGCQPPVGRHDCRPDGGCCPACLAKDGVGVWLQLPCRSCVRYVCMTAWRGAGLTGKLPAIA